MILVGEAGDCLMSAIEQSSPSDDDDFALRKPARKVPRLSESAECVCHCLSVGGPLSAGGERGWLALVNAGQVREDEVWDRLRKLSKDGAAPENFYYHRACYQSYTSKTNLDRVVARHSAITVDDSDADELKESKHAFPRRIDARSTLSSGSGSQKLLRSSVQLTDKSQCIICQSEKREQKNRRAKEKLRLCSTFAASTKLVEAAELWQNERILLAVSGTQVDAIAADVLYHPTCYREFTRSQSLNKLRDTPAECSDTYSDAFAKLANELEEKLVENGEVVTMPTLQKKFVSFLKSCGENVSHYRGEKLKRRLRKHFNDRLSFYQSQPSKPAVIYSSSMPVYHLAQLLPELEEGNSGSQSESDDYDLDIGMNRNNSDSESCPSTTHATASCSSEKVRTVYGAACILRQLLQFAEGLSWPPDESILLGDHLGIPPLLYNFLAWSLVGDTDTTPISEDQVQVPTKLDRHIRSIASDMLYVASAGRVKSTKHVVLPVAIHHLTGSTQVVRLLNRFGHSISVPQLQEVETALAERHIAKIQSVGVNLPSVIRPLSFAMFCWDNIDILEETLSGAGTTHCTNGIVVQRQVHGPLRESQLQCYDIVHMRTRQRSVNALPADVQPFNAGQRCEPQAYQAVDMSSFDVTREVCPDLLFDFIWLLARFYPSAEDFFTRAERQQIIPGWSGFNTLFQQRSVPPSVIGYCPVIPAPPTQLDVVYTLLTRSVSMAHMLGQQDVVVVVDQAVYAKAVEILWKKPAEFRSVVLRMGSFHMALAILATIGKRFGGSGWSDLVVEAGVLAPGSVAQVVAGKHYNRGLRVHKLVMEALLRFQLQAFGKWCEGKDLQVDLENVSKLLNDIRLVLACKTSDDSEDVHQRVQAMSRTASSVHVARLYYLFSEFCQSQSTPLAKFWQSYIDLVQLLLNFTRATRTGNWNLHLATLKAFLPWFFAYDRLNYARYASVYYCEMVRLERTHPEAYGAFQEGDFVVQRLQGSKFAQVAVDQTIEQTVNRDSKTSGGIVGFSTKPGATLRWVLTAHDRAALTNVCRQEAGMIDDTSPAHKETKKARLQKDEADVQCLASTLENWCNPFSASSDGELVCLSSGQAAGDTLQADLSQAFTQGMAACQKFVEDRLVKKTTPFYDKLAKMGLLTFSSKATKRTVKTSTREVILKADKALFSRLIILAQSRQMNLAAMLEYPLGPLPWALATADGSLVKTNKAALLHLLESGTTTVDNIPPAVWLIDGMALLQSMQTKMCKTFADLSMLVLKRLLSAQHCSARRVDFVTDSYLEQSIKSLERHRRSDSSCVRTRINSREQRCPGQWSKYMRMTENKKDFVDFLTQDWMNPEFAAVIGANQLYVVNGENCWKYTSFNGDSVQRNAVVELQSNQEEADTRLLLHAKHAAASGAGNVVIQSPDTDVAVICCALVGEIEARLLFKTGTQHRTRFVDLSLLVRNLNFTVKALPGFHAFTGCDSTSAFFGRGKKAGLQLLLKPNYCETMVDIGTTYSVTDALLEHCEKFVCAMYGKAQCTSVNHLRYLLFTTRACHTSQLPPCRNSLYHHLQRANYQAAVWKRALTAQADIPSPSGHGWITDTQGTLAILWNSVPPAPDALLECISCLCTRGCSQGRCSCTINGLQCTDLCKCTHVKSFSCLNRRKADDATPYDSGEDDQDNDKDQDDEAGASDFDSSDVSD